LIYTVHVLLLQKLCVKLCFWLIESTERVRGQTQTDCKRRRRLACSCSARVCRLVAARLLACLVTVDSQSSGWGPMQRYTLPYNDARRHPSVLPCIVSSSISSNIDSVVAGGRNLSLYAGYGGWRSGCRCCRLTF